MSQVIFQFENDAKPVVITVTPGTTLLEAARSANVAIDAPCSGNGSCGKCRVKLVEGEVDSYPSSHISEEDYAAGWRLSCASKVSGDVTVLVPDIASAYQSRMKTADLSSGAEIAILRSWRPMSRPPGSTLKTTSRSSASSSTSRRSTTPCRIPSVWSGASRARSNARM